MKKLQIGIVAITIASFMSCKDAAKATGSEEPQIKSEVTEAIALTDVSFGVRGNCGMCKSTIENAANSVDGVENAVWDVDAKNIALGYNPAKTDINAIHNAIAASGYDTELVSGAAKAYDELPGCCQYDHEMEMNQTVTEKTKLH